VAVRFIQVRRYANYDVRNIYNNPVENLEEMKVEIKEMRKENQQLKREIERLREEFKNREKNGRKRKTTTCLRE
jgi:regulator of replication initiation timing